MPDIVPPTASAATISFKTRLLGLGRFGLALVFGAAGGFLFWYLQTPLAWMLGPMTACMLASLVRLPVAVPGFVRSPMIAVVGLVLGSTFHPGTFDHVSEWAVPIVGVIVFTIAATLVSYLYFRKVGGFDRPTAFFAGAPGGLVDMVVMGGERGGDVRMISLVHAARIFLVVLILPFGVELLLSVDLPSTSASYLPLDVLSLDSLGWIIVTVVVGLIVGRLLRLPAGPLLGPMLVSGILHYTEVTDFMLPTLITAAAQLVIGAMIGCRFSGTSPWLILRVLLLSVGSAVLLLVTAFVFAETVSWLSGLNIGTVLFAYAPGGIIEMSLLALALSGDVAFVAIHHIVRVFLVIGGAMPFFYLVNRSRWG